MKKLSIVALLFSVTISFAQKKINPDPYAHSITAADLKKQLYIIAGPEMEGRATGTEVQRAKLCLCYCLNEKRLGSCQTTFRNSNGRVSTLPLLYYIAFIFIQLPSSDHLLNLPHLQYRHSGVSGNPSGRS